jgi:hypothetical protein
MHIVITTFNLSIRVVEAHETTTKLISVTLFHHLHKSLIQMFAFEVISEEL